MPEHEHNWYPVVNDEEWQGWVCIVKRCGLYVSQEEIDNE